MNKNKNSPEEPTPTQHAGIIKIRPRTEQLVLPIEQPELDLFNMLIERFCLDEFMCKLNAGQQPQDFIDVEACMKIGLELEEAIMSHPIIQDNVKKFYTKE